MKWNVIYSPQAKKDLHDIYCYIAFELYAPDTAAQQVERLDNMIQSLDELPMRYPVYDAEPIKSKGIRSVPVGNYLIFYFPQEKDRTVTIYRILYGGRDLSQREIE